MASKARILVLDGELRAALAIVRALGKNHVVAVASTNKRSLAGCSGSCVETFSYHDPRFAPNEFISDTLAVIDRWKPDLLIPVSDLTTTLVLENETAFREKTIIPAGTLAQLQALTDKGQLAAQAKKLGINVPRSLTFAASEAQHASTVKEIETFSYPAVLKAAVSETKTTLGFVKPAVNYVRSAAEVQTIVSSGPGDIGYLLQEEIIGEGYGVSVLCREGEVLSSFAHRRILEKPPRGGVSVLSESVSLSDAPVQDAITVIQSANWSGVAMVEFKRRAVDGKFFLIEVNPRFWGSVQLAVDAGVNFPEQLVSLFVNRQNPITPAQQYIVGQRLRWFWGTVDHTLICLKTPGARGDIFFNNALSIGQSWGKTQFEVLRFSDSAPFFYESKQWMRAIVRGQSLRPSGRVLLFIESGGIGGAERVILMLAQALQARGKKVNVVTCRDGWLVNSLRAHGVTHTQIRASSWSVDFQLIYRLVSLIRREQIEVLHTHSVDSGFYGALAAKLAGIPHVATEHGEVHHIDKKKWLTVKLRVMEFLGSQFTAVSEYSKKALVGVGISAERVVRVSNPVTIDSRLGDLSKRKHLRSEIRSQLGVPDTDWLWVHVANLRPVKDQQTLLRAFKIALSSPSSQRLVLVGDGPERARLESLVAELHLGEKVMFAGFSNDVAGYLAAGDGFILSSRSEAMPVSLLEAGAAGLVLIGSRVGGIPEVINEKTGYLFEAGDAQGLADVMQMVVADKSASTKRAQGGKDAITKNCEPLTVADRYSELYRRLAAHR